jgi:hypothetical protein
VTLILKPPGRGNWACLEIKFAGLHAPRPMDFQIGAMFPINGRLFRIAGVLA